MKTVPSVYTLIMNNTYISIPQYTGTAEGTNVAMFPINVSIETNSIIAMDSLS